jgi:cobalt-zinc-cadmium efflux system protein
MSHSHHHTHTHDHHGHHHHVPTTFNKAFAIAAILNLGFTLIEAIFALHAHSMGLLADAVHNLGDVLGLLMAWGANTLLSRNATEKYSYGYKKTTILSALANALMLVFVSALIIYESISRLFHPGAVQELIIIIVAAIGIVINGGTALLFLKGSEKDLNVKGAFLHLTYDALISVGVVLSGVIIYFIGWVQIDPIVGLIIVTLILINTWGLLRDSVDLILGAVPRGIKINAVRDYLKNIHGVEKIHDLHVWGLSTQENALTAHLIMPDISLTDEDLQRINHDLVHTFKINHVTLQIERGEKDNPCGQAEKC